MKSSELFFSVTIEYTKKANDKSIGILSRNEQTCAIEEKERRKKNTFIVTYFIKHSYSNIEIAKE